MEVTLDGFAFAGFIAAQFLGVIAVHKMKLSDDRQSSSIAAYRNDSLREGDRTEKDLAAACKPTSKHRYHVRA